MNGLIARLKQSDWLPVLTSVLTFVFGLIGGQLLETLIAPLFATETRALLVSLFIVSLLAISTLIAVNAFARRAEKREQIWCQLIQGIKDRLGIPAELVFERIGGSRGGVYRRLTEFIRGASVDDEILIMAHCGPKSGIENPRETPAYKQAREEYSRILLQKAAEPGVTYRRIICFDTGPTEGKIRAEYVKRWLLDHCHDMLQIRETKPDKIALKKSVVIFDRDVLIIGKKVAVISVDIRDPKTELVHTDGAIIFYNPPNAQIIEQLYAFFIEADGASVSVNKIPEECEEP